MLALAVLTLVCALTYGVEIVFGLAGTILMLPVMSFFYDTKTLVVYSCLPQILVGVIGLARSPRTVELPVLGRMLAAAAIGAVVGFAVFYALPETVFRALLAAVVIFFGIYLVVAPARLRLAPAAARALDALAGASQALFGISGPIAMTRLLASFRDKLSVRNYALAFFLSLNLLRAGTYLVNGTITSEIATMMAASALPLALTLWYANHLHFRVREERFRRVVAWLILLGGLTLFFG
jgi:uncharacterized membrane protein YfcA